MFHCCFETHDHQPADPSTVEGPQRKTAKTAIRAAVIQAIKEGYGDERVRLRLFEDGAPLLTVFGDTPEQARQEAIALLDRNRRRS